MTFSIPSPLVRQLNLDEQCFRDNQNLEQLENVLAVREAAKNQAWFNKVKGYSIVVHKGKVIAINSSSLLALGDGVRMAGTSNVYMVYISGAFDTMYGNETMQR